MELTLELAERLVDTYTLYRANLAAKHENTQNFRATIEDGLARYALTIYDLRKLQVPEYIAKPYTGNYLFDSSLSFQEVKGFRDEITRLVNERIEIDKEYDDLAAQILAIKNQAQANGIPFIKVLQATKGIDGEELKKSTIYTFISRLENRTTEKKLEKMAFYLLHKELGLDINTLSERTGKAKPTIFNLSRSGKKLFEASNGDLANLTVDELIEIAKGDTPTKTTLDTVGNNV